MRLVYMVFWLWWCFDDSGGDHRLVQKLTGLDDSIARRQCWRCAGLPARLEYVVDGVDNISERLNAPGDSAKNEQSDDKQECFSHRSDRC